MVYRFRLAVLLLDTLRRLRYKPEARLREALTRLPGGVFEAYDRIFELIAEEAQQTDSADETIVRDALSWIYHCNEIYETEYILPIKVIQRETNSTDQEELRGLLGCLVRVVQRPMHDLCVSMEACESADTDSREDPFMSSMHTTDGSLDKAPKHKVIDVVDFAHYSVREYLEYQQQKRTMPGQVRSTMLDNVPHPSFGHPPLWATPKHHTATSTTLSKSLISLPKLDRFFPGFLCLFIYR